MGLLAVRVHEAHLCGRPQVSERSKGEIRWHAWRYAQGPHKVRTGDLDFSGCDESESHWVCVAKGASWLPIRVAAKTDAGM